MEVAALEKKGHRAFAKPLKSLSSSEHKRSKSYFEDMYATDAWRSSDKTIVLPKPEVVKAKVKSGINKDVQPERGAQSTLRKEDVVALVKMEEEPEAAARKLTETAFSRGSGDNITCIVVITPPKFNHAHNHV